MRTLRRRAAIGATSVALLFAAAGSSLAAVRAARYQGGVTGSALSLPVPPTAADPGADPGTSLPPTAETPIVAEGGTAIVPHVVDPITGLPSPGSGTATGPSPSSGLTPPPTNGVAPPAGTPPARVTLPRGPQATVGPNAPVSGPTPTVAPGLAPGSAACPSDSRRGALPPGTGRLEAVDFSLPWPGAGPVVLAPQASAIRSSNAPVIIVGISAGSLAGDGSSLTLASPVATSYFLVGGGEQAAGTIRFVPPSRTVHVDHRACRGRRMAIYDVNRGSLNGSPLRIVGMVAPAGEVVIAGDGGTAHFRSAAPGVYSITLLTANDAGEAGPLITATVTVP